MAAMAEAEPAEEVVLEPCGKCGRKFAAARLEKHAKVCKGTGVAATASAAPERSIKPAASPMPERACKPLQAAAFAEADSSAVVELEACPKCQRKFNPSRLETHAKVCKGGDSATRARGASAGGAAAGGVDAAGDSKAEAKAGVVKKKEAAKPAAKKMSMADRMMAQMEKNMEECPKCQRK
jgi:hypothetical protein